MFRLLDTPPAPGPWNMALDEALMESVRAGAPSVLRFYRWHPRCLSLGRNQPARDRYDLALLAARGTEVVRRPTGGRAVLHDRELTYSVTAPEGTLGSLRESYAAINRALAAGLRRLGVPAALQPRGERASAPSLAPCFRVPAEGELVAGGRKLVGSAQWREQGVMLQHGSLLLEDDQEGVRDFVVSSPDPSPHERPAVLRDFCDPLPSWEALTAALAAGWEEALGIALESGEPTAAELACAQQRAARYASAAWTWRL